MNTLFNCSLWGDEAFSAVLAQRPFWPMIKIVANDTSPPLMYIIMWIWFRIFGSSEIAIRSLSLLFFLGTIAVIYLIAKELFSKQAGILAAILSFFNPFLFPYAFEGRMYFCLLFFVTLSFYFLIKKNKLAYIISASAALYSHHFAIIALAPQFLWQLRQIKEYNLSNWWKLIRTYLLIGLFYLPWFYPLYLQTQRVSTGFWLGTPKLKHLGVVFIHFLIHKLIYQIQKFVPPLVIAILALRKWSKKHWPKYLLLISWVVIPPVLTFLISQTSLSIFYERYLLYCVPPIMILLSSKIRKLSWLPITVLLIIYVSISSYYFSHPHKKPFRQFAEWIKENTQGNIFLVNYNGSSHHLWETKYYGLNAPLYVPNGKLPFYVGTAQMTKVDVVRQLPQNKPIGLISSEPPEKIEVEAYQVKSYHQNNGLYFIIITKNENKI